MKGTEFVLGTLPKAGVDHLFMFVGGLVDPFLAPVSAGIASLGAAFDSTVPEADPPAWEA
jgi:hypothetical protein